MTVLEFKQRPPEEAVTNSPELSSAERVETASPSPASTQSLSFEDQRVDLENRIEELFVEGGETYLWLTNAYAELGHLLTAQAARQEDNFGLLQEAEGNLLLSLDIATVNGNTKARIDNLHELSLVASMMGDEALADARSEQAAKLQKLDGMLEAIRPEDRLRYNYPAIDPKLSKEEQIVMKRALRGAVAEAWSDYPVNDLEIASASNLLTAELLDASSQGRWIDDLFVLEMAQNLSDMVTPNLPFDANKRASYKALLPAAEFMDLGLHKRSIEQIKKI